CNDFVAGANSQREQTEPQSICAAGNSERVATAAKAREFGFETPDKWTAGECARIRHLAKCMDEFVHQWLVMCPQIEKRDLHDALSGGRGLTRAVGTRLQHSGRVSRNDGAGRDVFGYHAAGSDGRAFPDFYTAQNRCIRAD